MSLLSFRTVLPAMMLLVLGAGLARADLSGDLTIQSKDPKQRKTLLQKGKVFYDGSATAPKAIRMEMAAEGDKPGIVFITRPEEQMAYMLLPEAKTYMPLDLKKGGEGQKLPEAPGARSREALQLREVGKATVDGHPTTVRAGPLNDKNGKKVGEMKVYLAKDLDDAPIKSELKLNDGSTTVSTLSNTSTRQLAANLFTPPDSYSETRIPSLDDMSKALGKETRKGAEEGAKESADEEAAKARQKEKESVKEGIKKALPF
jgi:hypothetical protein